MPEIIDKENSNSDVSMDDLNSISWHLLEQHSDQSSKSKYEKVHDQDYCQELEPEDEDIKKARKGTSIVGSSNNLQIEYRPTLGISLRERKRKAIEKWLVWCGGRLCNYQFCPYEINFLTIRYYYFIDNNVIK